MTESEWQRVKALVLHMCQISHDNGPVAARQKLDEMLAKLRELCGVK